MINECYLPLVMIVYGILMSYDFKDTHKILDT